MINRIKLEIGNFLFYSILLFNFIRCLIIAITELSIAAICVYFGKLTKHDPLWKYGRNKALAMDQWGNTELLGNPDETISSRLGRSYGKERYFWVKWLRCFVDYYAAKLFQDHDHCRRSIISEEQLQFKKLNYEIWSWQINDNS